MKFKSTVAQAVFDEAQALLKESEVELRSLLPRCQSLGDYAAVIGVINERRLTGFLAAAKAAQEIEMQSAGTAAIIAANCQPKP